MKSTRLVENVAYIENIGKKVRMLVGKKDEKRQVGDRRKPVK
jgi:hypothetical protein